MDGPIVSVHPTLISYRASALGGCPRALYAARMGYDAKSTPKQMQLVFDRGHEIENITKQILRQHYNIDLLRDQEEVTLTIGTVNGKRVVVVGHIDGYTVETGINEIKGFGEDFLRKYVEQGVSAFPRYKYQIACYCYAMDEPRWRYIVYDKDSDSDEFSADRLLIASFNTPPMPLHEIVERVLYIEKAAKESAIPDCTNEYPCPYFYLHDEESKGELTTLAIKLATTYNSLGQRAKSLKEAQKRIAERLTSMIPHDPTNNKFANALGTVMVTFVQNVSRLDQSKALKILQDAEVDPSEYMTTGEGEYPKVTVK